MWSLKREVNPVKHGACLETSFQPSLYRLYQSFCCRLHQSFLAVTPARLYACARTAPETPWTAMHTFLNVTMAHLIVRLRVTREIQSQARHKLSARCDLARRRSAPSSLVALLAPTQAQPLLWAGSGHETKHDHVIHAPCGPWNTK